MFKKILFFSLLLFLISPALALDKTDDTTKIIVSGRGEVKADADLSYINLAVEETQKSAGQAQKLAAQKMQDILSALQKSGIDKKDIQTAGFRINPQYRYDRGESTLTGYLASNEIRVTFSHMEKIGNIIDTAIGAGANRVNNVIFTLKDDSQPKKQALKQAFDNAREKAQSIAAAAGLKIKKILIVQESSAQVIPPDVGLRAMKAEGLGGGAETPIVPGKVGVSADLTVIYECVKL